jgi:hypothetical protein
MTIRNRSRLYGTLWAAVALTLIFVTLHVYSAQAISYIDLHGVVVNRSDQAPIGNVEITSYYPRSARYQTNQWQRDQTTYSTSDGEFSLKLEDGRTYLIVISHKNESKLFDYVPYGINFVASHDSNNVTVELMKSSTIYVQGLAYFMDTTSIPQTTFRVLDPISHEPLVSGSMPITFGGISGSFSDYLNIPQNVVIVPAETGFTLNVISSFQTKGSSSQQLWINDFKEGLKEGQVTEIDLRSYSMPNSIMELNATEEINSQISVKEKQGFYLAVERQRLGGAVSVIDEAQTLMSRGEYDKAFTKLREAYIDVSNLRNGINGW